MDSTLEYFAERNSKIQNKKDAKSFLLISPSYGESFRKAENILKSLLSYNRKKINILMRRCASNVLLQNNIQVFNKYSPSCFRDNDCPNKEKCTFSRYNETVIFYSISKINYQNEYIESISSWIDIIKDESPDVVIITDVEGAPSILELGRRKHWIPNGIVLTELAAARCSVMK